jgi:uncharacterized protein YycO
MGRPARRIPPTALLVLALLACSATQAQPLALRDGDIVFQTSLSRQSLAVQRATGSHYSHMGMVMVRGGRPFVLEAAGTVRYTPLKEWAARGQDGRIVAKRLKDADAVLTPPAVARLREAAATLHGRPYDLTFEWSDERLYCSELVWKVYERALGIRIGPLQRIRDFNLADPLVRRTMAERYGSAVPLDEPVISPVAMFASDRLVTVAPSPSAPRP